MRPWQTTRAVAVQVSVFSLAVALVAVAAVFGWF